MTEVIYLLSSCARYIYKNDVYRTLASPAGYITNLRYRRKWVSETVWRAAEEESLAGREVILVGAIERGWGQIVFYPLRRGEIVFSEKDSSVLHLYVALGKSDRDEWIKYEDDGGYNPELNSRFESLWDNASKNEPVGAFEAERDFLTFDGDDAWSGIVDVLSRHGIFDSGLFYRIAGVTDIRDAVVGSSSADLEKINNVSRAYEIESAQNYALELILDFGHSTPSSAEDSVLEIKSTRNIDVFPDSINLGFKVDKKRISINAEPMEYGSIEYLRFSVDGTVEAAMFEMPLILKRFSGR